MDSDDGRLDETAHEWVEELGKRAGAALRQPAPETGLAALRRQHTRRRAIGAVAGGAAALTLVVGVLIITRRDDHRQTGPFDQTPTTIAVTTSSSPSTTIASSTTSPLSTTSALSTTTNAPLPPPAPEGVVVRGAAELPAATLLADAADQTVDLDYLPTFAVADGDTFWVSDYGTGALERRSAETGELLGFAAAVQPSDTLQVARPAIGFGSAWVVQPNRVVRIAPDTFEIVADIALEGSGSIEALTGFISDLAVTPTGVWSVEHAQGAFVAREDRSRGQRHRGPVPDSARRPVDCVRRRVAMGHERQRWIQAHPIRSSDRRPALAA